MNDTTNDLINFRIATDENRCSLCFYYGKSSSCSNPRVIKFRVHPVYTCDLWETAVGRATKVESHSILKPKSTCNYCRKPGCVFRGDPENTGGKCMNPEENL